MPSINSTSNRQGLWQMAYARRQCSVKQRLRRRLRERSKADPAAPALRCQNARLLQVLGRRYMPAWSPPRAIEIDKKLRDNFQRMLREYGITTQETDPILAVLFRSLAAQVEEVYQQAA